MFSSLKEKAGDIGGEARAKLDAWQKETDEAKEKLRLLSEVWRGRCGEGGRRGH